MNKLTKLRALFDQYNVEAFLVPQADEFRSQNLAPYAQRLGWLTGFTGSAGLAIVARDKAALFVDPRYTLQAKQEVCRDGFEVLELSQDKILAWLQENTEGQRIGFDPWLHTSADLESYQYLCLQEVPNLIDLVWYDRPVPPNRQLVVHPVEYAGQSHYEKLAALRHTMNAQCIDAFVFVDSASIAWLLNIRGSDVAYTPVALLYAVVYQEHVDLYGCQTPLSEVVCHLGEKVHFWSLDKFGQDLQSFKGLTISFDPQATPDKVAATLALDNHIILAQDPSLHKRAVKNAVEQEGMRQCHIWDGVALTKFIFWFENNSCADEYTAAQKLLEFRAQQPLFQQPSFETIAGFAENGALVHYRPNAGLSRRLDEQGLLLIDSGGQYLNGTTDVTRVLVKGCADPVHIETYTTVLKGHIGLARAQFPRGITGPQLDVLARMPLWQKGQDFGHATGHGVGSYLNVHEGPHYIGRTLRTTAPLEPGMIVSNEPGYYQEGAFGIRLESLMLVREDPSWGPEYLSFETLTMAPFEPRLIEIGALNEEERQWLNYYHERVAEALMPYLEPQERAWLAKVTRPLLQQERQ